MCVFPKNKDVLLHKNQEINIGSMPLSNPAVLKAFSEILLRGAELSTYFYNNIYTIFDFFIPILSRVYNGVFRGFMVSHDLIALMSVYNGFIIVI